MTSPNCFVLLDDAQSTATSSRLYTGLHAELSCRNTQEWDACWEQAESALTQNYFLVALLQYETGAQLQKITQREDLVDGTTRLLVFKHCQKIDVHQAQVYLQNLAGTSPAGIRGIRSSVDELEFSRAIEQIRQYIAAGDTYQVNYTYRLHFKTYGTAAALYLALRQRQPVPYGAFIALPNGEAILSFSPELFVRHHNGTLFARPMKGTAAASGDDVLDQKNAEALSHDPKNRAENLMIVDLLRNDLGRIAVTGSVRVPQLFEVTRFSSVLQMTSSIEARVRGDLNLSSVMRALFPCGSITGAPKKRTMEIIRELESEARGLYTGAIGWFDPPEAGQKLANFCLSVPIRTLELQAEIDGQRQGRMGVGAGIVFDSKVEEEFAECQLKARFLTGLQPMFELFETIYATRAEGCRAWALHRSRLQTSAAFFGFSADFEAIEIALQKQIEQLASNDAYRLRLSLASNGQFRIQCASLPPLTLHNGSIAYLFAPNSSRSICTSVPLFLRHKTSHRAEYDEAWKLAESLGAFDFIFVNARGQITEGGRSTVFAKIKGEWRTPPLSDGVLPGVLRTQMLADAAWNLKEASISIEEFESAEQVMLGNALRGLLPAYRMPFTPED